MPFPWHTRIGELFDVIEGRAEVVVQLVGECLGVLEVLGDGDAEGATQLALLVDAEREVMAVPDDRVLDAGRTPRFFHEACHTRLVIHVQVSAQVLYYIAEHVALLGHSQFHVFKLYSNHFL